jgi:hypothetical protein
MAIPAFQADGDLPTGVFRATLSEVSQVFGRGSAQRRRLTDRLVRLHQLAASTGRLLRFIVFGSYVTAKPEPRDVDLFLLMADDFDVSQVPPDIRLLFDHSHAEQRFGASIFWLRPQSCLNGPDAAVAEWQITRSGASRGIIEIVEDQS